MVTSTTVLVMMFNIIFIVSPKTTSFHQPLQPWPHEPWALVAQPTAPVASRKPSMTSKNQAVNGRITSWSFVYPIIKKVSCISAGNSVVSFKIMALLGYQLVPINGEPLQNHHSERWWVGSFQSVLQYYNQPEQTKSQLRWKHHTLSSHLPELQSNAARRCAAGTSNWCQRFAASGAVLRLPCEASTFDVWKFKQCVCVYVYLHIYIYICT